eukprot:scaffold107886_cov17-Tisochrysis_lutea.AAC.1
MHLQRQQQHMALVIAFDQLSTRTRTAMCVQGLLWETSLLDPDEGIRLRGYSLPELQVGRSYIMPGVVIFELQSSGEHTDFRTVSRAPYLLLIGGAPAQSRRAALARGLVVAPADWKGESEK